MFSGNEVWMSNYGSRRLNMDLDDVLVNNAEALVIQTNSATIAMVEFGLQDGSRLKARGEAKKDHADKFNSDIGSNLALARALESAARKFRKRSRVAENGGK